MEVVLNRCGGHRATIRQCLDKFCFPFSCRSAIDTVGTSRRRALDRRHISSSSGSVSNRVHHPTFVSWDALPDSVDYRNPWRSHKIPPEDRTNNRIHRKPPEHYRVPLVDTISPWCNPGTRNFRNSNRIDNFVQENGHIRLRLGNGDCRCHRNRKYPPEWKVRDCGPKIHVGCRFYNWILTRRLSCSSVSDPLITERSKSLQQVVHSV